MKKIVVVAPHSDDETLGAGGYILKHKDSGDEVIWINVTNAKSEYGYTNEEVCYWREVVDKVRKEYGFDDFYDLALEPSGLDKLDKSKLISLFRNLFSEILPNVVLLPYGNDAHSDHRIVFDAVMACCKTFRLPEIEKIMCMEILSETDYAYPDVGFVPDYYVDISNYIEKKIDILSAYESEIMKSPFPRSIDAVMGLAKYRGASCYSHYAEAFKIVKIVER